MEPTDGRQQTGGCPADRASLRQLWLRFALPFEHALGGEAGSHPEPERSARNGGPGLVGLGLIEQVLEQRVVERQDRHGDGRRRSCHLEHVGPAHPSVGEGIDR